MGVSAGVRLTTAATVPSPPAATTASRLGPGSGPLGQQFQVGGGLDLPTVPLQTVTQFLYGVAIRPRTRRWVGDNQHAVGVGRQVVDQAGHPGFLRSGP